MKDKYSATWLSHSSISDYLKCPRSYFLKNIYKNPASGRKVMITSPALSLGQSVHEVVESLSTLPVSDRLVPNLQDQFVLAFEKFSGKRGGFKSFAEEQETKLRGIDMLKRITAHPGPISRPAIKIRQDLPYYWLSEDENIILCGKIDWLEYVPDLDGVNILDFKTGKYDEDPDSLQLPIYLLLVTHTQSKPVLGAAYWYLDRDDQPKTVTLPDLDTALATLTPIAKKIVLARKLQHFSCPQLHGCRACLPYENIVSGKAEQVDVRDNKDIYVIP